MTSSQVTKNSLIMNFFKKKDKNSFIQISARECILQLYVTEILLRLCFNNKTVYTYSTDSCESSRINKFSSNTYSNFISQPEKIEKKMNLFMFSQETAVTLVIDM